MNQVTTESGEISWGQLGNTAPSTHWMRDAQFCFLCAKLQNANLQKRKRPICWRWHMHRTILAVRCMVAQTYGLVVGVAWTAAGGSVSMLMCHKQKLVRSAQTSASVNSRCICVYTDIGRKQRMHEYMHMHEQATNKLTGKYSQKAYHSLEHERIAIILINMKAQRHRGSHPLLVLDSTLAGQGQLSTVD
jgi:hypothetical protein